MTYMQKMEIYREVRAYYMREGEIPLRIADRYKGKAQKGAAVEAGIDILREQSRRIREGGRS